MNCELCESEINEFDTNNLIEGSLCFLEEITHEINVHVKETGLIEIIKRGICVRCLNRLGMTKAESKGCPICKFPKLECHTIICGFCAEHVNDC